MSPTGGDSGAELVAVTASAEREAARLRDRLAEIEVEQATLEAELAVFNADYMRVVMTVMLDVQELEARILALLATRAGARGKARVERLGGSGVAGVMERAMAATAAGGDLLAGLRRAAEVQREQARARLAALEGRA